MRLSFDLHERPRLVFDVQYDPGWIHFFDAGEENGVDPDLTEEVYVGFEGAGVFGEIFVRGKLGGVDEDAGYDFGALLFG